MDSRKVFSKVKALKCINFKVVLDSSKLKVETGEDKTKKKTEFQKVQI